MMILFKLRYGSDEVAVNPDHIIVAERDSDDSYTRLFMVGETRVNVKETPGEIAYQIAMQE